MELHTSATFAQTFKISPFKVDGIFEFEAYGVKHIKTFYKVYVSTPLISTEYGITFELRLPLRNFTAKTKVFQNDHIML